MALPSGDWLWVTDSVRPPLLFPLFASVDSLPGLGAKLARLMEKLTGPHVVDVLWHLPTGVIDRRFAPKIIEAPAGRVATLTVRVDAHLPPQTSRQPWRVRCSDETGFMELAFFRSHGDYLNRVLPVGGQVVISGRMERFRDLPQMNHPDAIVPVEARADLETVEALYPLTGGLVPKVLRKAVKAALNGAPALPEWLDPALKNRENWPDWREALWAAHHPDDESLLDPGHPARARLAYDELLANQLALALVRHHQRRQGGRVTAAAGALRQAVRQTLPFALTGCQETAIGEILADMASRQRMLRLLQGDVGSGKTVVALMAMLEAVEAGAQAALMAPTELLARQHLETMAPLLLSTGVSLALLTGRDKGKGRATLLERLADGRLDLLLGTHALLQDDVVFKDLALAVIDEQHRFGVQQRLHLTAKGREADVLVMTATPIPRTLTLTAYGDMDVSRLTEKPPGRKPVDTRTIALDRLPEVLEGLRRTVREGARVYWICPLVEESESVDLAAAVERHVLLRRVFGERVGLVHGRMKGPEKDAVMAAFATGDLDVLVATTVVEVGVNVPEATVMVVEHAERFGLAQLHQLRGRVGRGEKASVCLLLFEASLNATARARLAILRETEDGFRIAEEDLRLRGSGELLGTRQSGLPQTRLADLARHGDLLAMARDDAGLIINRDPDLETPRGEALRVLLYLFQRDAAIRLLRSG